jgi:hypothetical protein
MKKQASSQKSRIPIGNLLAENINKLTSAIGEDAHDVIDSNYCKSFVSKIFGTLLSQSMVKLEYIEAAKTIYNQWLSAQFSNEELKIEFIEIFKSMCLDLTNMKSSNLSNPLTINKFKQIIDFIYGKHGINATDLMPLIPQTSEFKSFRNYIAEKATSKSKEQKLLKEIKFEGLQECRSYDYTVANIFYKALNGITVDNSEISNCFTKNSSPNLQENLQINLIAAQDLYNFYGTFFLDRQKAIHILKMSKNFPEIAREEFSPFVNRDLVLQQSKLLKSFAVRDKKYWKILESLKEDIIQLKNQLEDQPDLYATHSKTIAEGLSLMANSCYQIEEKLKYCVEMLSYIPEKENLETFNEIVLNLKLLDDDYKEIYYFNLLINQLTGLSPTLKAELVQWFGQFKDIAFQSEEAFINYQAATKHFIEKSPEVAELIKVLVLESELIFYIQQNRTDEALEVIKISNFSPDYILTYLSLCTNVTSKLAEFIDNFDHKIADLSSIDLAKIFLNLYSSQELENKDKYYQLATQSVKEANKMLKGNSEFNHIKHTEKLLKINYTLILIAILKGDDYFEYINFIKEVSPPDYESLIKLIDSIFSVAQVTDEPQEKSDFSEHDSKYSEKLGSEKILEPAVTNESREISESATKVEIAETISTEKAAATLDVHTSELDKVTYSEEVPHKKELSEAQLIHLEYQYQKAQKELNDIYRKKTDLVKAKPSWKIAADKTAAHYYEEIVQIDSAGKLYAVLDPNLRLAQIQEYQFKTSLYKGLVHREYGQNGVKKIGNFYELKINGDSRIIASKAYVENNKTLLIFDKPVNHSEVKRLSQENYETKIIITENYSEGYSEELIESTCDDSYEVVSSGMMDEHNHDIT